MYTKLGSSGTPRAQTWAYLGHISGTSRAKSTSRAHLRQNHLGHTSDTPRAHLGNTSGKTTWGTPRAHLGHTPGGFARDVPEVCPRCAPGGFAWDVPEMCFLPEMCSRCAQVCARGVHWRITELPKTISLESPPYLPVSLEHLNS